jgi:mRNA interferase RelE/StbE
MASFRIEWRRSTKKDLRKIPPRDVQRIVEAVEALADEPFPFGVEKLKGAERTYRIRVGDFRVIYEVFADTKVIEIERVRNRKDVYR